MPNSPYRNRRGALPTAIRKTTATQVARMIGASTGAESLGSTSPGVPIPPVLPEHYLSVAEFASGTVAAGDYALDEDYVYFVTPMGAKRKAVLASL
jgi:hypothetical protein